MKAQVPANWSYYWLGPTNPLQYVQVLLTNFAKLVVWVAKVPTKQLYEHPIDLSELLRPNLFIDALGEKACGCNKYGYFFFIPYITSPFYY